jgi:hypothetical protein
VSKRKVRTDQHIIVNNTLTDKQPSKQAKKKKKKKKKWVITKGNGGLVVRKSRSAISLPFGA